MKASNRQTLLDLAMIGCGDAAAAIAMAILNGVPVTDDLIQTVDYSLPDVVDKNIANYYANNGLSPATGMTEIEENELNGEGIEYWAIEYDFEVS
jgi:hypothetical protein